MEYHSYYYDTFCDPIDARWTGQRTFSTHTPRTGNISTSDIAGAGHSRSRSGGRRRSRAGPCASMGGASRDGGEGPMCVTDRWRGRGGPHRQGLCRPTKASGRVRTAGLGSPQAHHRLDDTPEKETDAISNTRRVHRGADPGSAVWGLRPPVPCERKVFSLGRPEKMFWMCGVRLCDVVCACG